MKQLSINHISAASIRANRKTYLSLVFGIFLAVYLAAAVSLCGYGILKSKEQQIIERVGTTDCVLFDEPDVSDERLRQSGLFSDFGRLFLKAEIKDSEVYLGYPDEDGAAILCQSLLDGRLPERAGEIAVERGVLEKLRIEASVGDTLRLTITPINGLDEERELTLVGLLREQSPYFNLTNEYVSTGHLMSWPSVLISPEESFDTGRTVIHRVMRYAPLVTLSRVQNAFDPDYREGISFFGIRRTEGQITSYDPVGFDAGGYFEQLILIIILGVSLLLVTTIGISSAMESVLDSKTEEIGMLRAVGATKRQIRRIFGRDPWLISLITLPPALILAVLTAWIFSLIMPERLEFAFSLWMLLPTVLISALSILVSSALPLLRASRQMPMGALRDTSLLRKAKRFHSRETFTAPRLIALRQFSLHPWRQLGAALMLSLTLLFLTLFGNYAMEFAKGYGTPGVAFSLYPLDRSDMHTYDFAMPALHYDLTEQDLTQIEAIPHVTKAERRAYTMVNLVVDGEIPTYLQPFYHATGRNNLEYSFDVVGNSLSGLDYLLMDDSTPAPPKVYYGETGFLAWRSYETFQQMRAASDAWNIDGKLLPVMVELIGSWSNMQEEGIDWEALDRGEQVLVYAPAPYVYRDQQTNDYVLYPIRDDSHHEQLGDPVAHIENDYFHVGQSLSFVQLLQEGQRQTIGYEDDLSSYAAMEKRETTVSIGAVFTAGDNIASREFLTFYTTPKGAAAMGICMSQPEMVTVSLDGEVDLETEKAIETRLTDIARRGEMRVYNHLASLREDREIQTRFLLLLAGMLLMFFAVSVSMQINSSGRRIRADERMIGTLRAVGADEKALLGCYRIPVLICTCFGTLFELLLLPRVAKVFFGIHGWHPAIMIPLTLILAALCAMCSLSGTKARLKGVLEESIVENIREL